MNDEARPPPPPADLVLTFLESVGKRSEAELYLELFQGLPPESFACIAVEASVVAHARHTLVQQLSFLANLGLVTPIVLGLFDPAVAESAAQRLALELRAAGMSVEPRSAATPAQGQRLRELLRAGVNPVVSFNEEIGDRDARLQRLGGWLRELSSRKLVVLRIHGGLGPKNGRLLRLSDTHVLPTHAGGISVINLASDDAALRNSGALSEEERSLLDGFGSLVRNGPGGSVGPALQVTIASPLTLLRELFTVKGAGTLLKRGAEVRCFKSYDSLDVRRLRGLLESAFDRPIDDGFFRRPPLAVYLEQDYRGAVILEPAPTAPFLTKFAVDRIAQGEGMGRDLWEAVVRDHPRFYWRARPGNRITGWYTQLCDGLVRSDRWTVFWRGIDPREIPKVVSDAIHRTEDFAPKPQAS